MPLRFRRRVRLAKGLYLNLSKTGVSASIGGRGATLNISKRGTRTTVGLPGSGISYRFPVRRWGRAAGPTAPPASPAASSTIGRAASWLLLALAALALIISLTR